MEGHYPLKVETVGSEPLTVTIKNKCKYVWFGLTLKTIVVYS